MKQSLESIRENPHDTIKKWVQQFTRSLYDWAYYKVSDKAMAEDLVQDTFLSAYQSLGNFRNESSPKTWLFSILNHKIADHLRKKVKDPVTDHESAGFENYFDRWDAWNEDARPQDWATDEQELLDNPDFRNAMQQCMGRLPGKWNAAIQLKYLEEKDGNAICQDLEISSSNFWQILHRAKLQLRKCLELHWFKK